MKFWIFWGLVGTFVLKNEAGHKCNSSSLTDPCKNGSNRSCDSLKKNIPDVTPEQSRNKTGKKSKRAVTELLEMGSGSHIFSSGHKEIGPGQQSSSNGQSGEGPGQESSSSGQSSHHQTTDTMESYIKRYKDGMNSNFSKDAEAMEKVVEETNVTESTLLRGNNSMAWVYKHEGPFNGTEFHSDKNKSVTNQRNADTIVSAYLPKCLDIDEEDRIIFCILQFPNETAQYSTFKLYEQRMVGLSVANKSVSGLSERVNLTMSFSLAPNKSAEPLCVFLNYTSGNWSTNGCLTLWNETMNQVTCSCDHLTYFGVLLAPLSSDEQILSPEDVQILSYITLIGCGISLTALAFTVVLFFTHSKIRADDSKKIHINLVFALIFLNLHLLPNEKVATLSLPGLCLYMALALHYSLLATFSWMALEGFHLYLLIVKVFNIHTNRYLLKISVIGWGVPAVIVSIVVSIKKEHYGLSTLNNSSLCYITDRTVELVTTTGLFALLFVFNTVMFSLTVRYLITSRRLNNFGPMKKNRTKDMGLLLFLISLLGIAWGFYLFSFGPLVTPSLYIFCILNSLQGFFIFLYFVLTLRKIKDSTSSSGHKTNSSSS